MSFCLDVRLGHPEPAHPAPAPHSPPSSKGPMGLTQRMFAATAQLAQVGSRLLQIHARCRGGLGVFPAITLAGFIGLKAESSINDPVSRQREAAPQPELRPHSHPSPSMPQAPPPLPQAPPPPCKPRRPRASPASWHAVVPELAPSFGWRAAAGSGQVEPDPPRCRFPHFLPRAPQSLCSQLGLQLQLGLVPE